MPVNAIKFLLTAAFLMPAMPVLAEPAQPKITIAVYKIQANNCPAEVARAVEELMISRLYSTSLFVLMEKSQMDRIAQNNGFKDFDTTNAAQVAKLGMILNVEKIIVGSVNKVGNYKLEIRAIDVKTGAVDITVPVDGDDEDDLNEAISEIADTLERYYLGYDRISGKWDFSLTGSLIYALGALGNGTSFGYGGSFTGAYNGVFFDNLSAIARISAHSLQPDKDKIRSLYMFPVTIGFGYTFHTSKTLAIRPELSGGLLHSRVDRDVDGSMTNGSYSYVKSSHFNGIINFGLEFSFFIHNRYHMVVKPSMTVLAENHYSILPSLDLGIKAVF